MKKQILSIMLVIILFGSSLFGCGNFESNSGRDEVSTNVNSAQEEQKEELFGEKKSAFGNVTAPASFDWRQCEGTTLDFIVENNINANILSRECSHFTEATGINVRIRNVDFDTMVEQINMEFISQAGQYELIYVDPYQTLTRFGDCLEDLNYFEQNPQFPNIVGGLESFSQEQVDICSYYLDREKLYTIPFDSTTMIFYYRKDIFQKYGSQMKADLGYNPMPGTSDFTWERYLEVSEWMETHIPKEEILYPGLTMSAEHNSVYVEFSNVMSAYGGDYFKSSYVNSLGITQCREIASESKEFIQALEVYKKLTGATPQIAGKLNWDESAELFKEGKAAMMINWDEKAVMMENKKNSKVHGKTGYCVLPYGESRSSNLYGGSGIGINRYISDEKKLAAWMFIVWCTSPQVQINTFLEEEGGNMPTRTNLLHLITGQYMAGLPQAQAVITAQKPAYAYYRPKLGKGYEFEQLIASELENMILEDLEPVQTADAIKKGWEKILASGEGEVTEP